MNTETPDMPWQEPTSEGEMVYVVDRDLNVFRVDEEWTNFARANNGHRLVGDGWNRKVLSNFSGSQRIRWRSIYGALLSGRLPLHEEDFICPSPVERRTFRLRIEPRHDAAGKVSYLVHRTTRCDRGPSARSLLGERLRRLDADPAAIVDVYRAQVLERRIRPARFRAAWRLQPLDEVGGDLLWHHEHPDGDTDLVIADAMGHGADAARLAAKTVVLLDSLTERKLGVAPTVSELNRLFLPQRGAEPGEEGRALFATGLYLRMNARRQSLVLCDFGHAAPIFSRAGQIKVESGLPVGLMEEQEPWPEVALDLATHGRRFLIFTDGVTEQFNPEGEMFGTAALEREFAETLALPLPAMLDRICAQLAAFRGEALVKDDQTLLGLEYAP